MAGWGAVQREEFTDHGGKLAANTFCAVAGISDIERVKRVPLFRAIAVAPKAALMRSVEADLREPVAAAKYAGMIIDSVCLASRC